MQYLWRKAVLTFADKRHGARRHVHMSKRNATYMFGQVTCSKRNEMYVFTGYLRLSTRYDIHYHNDI